MNREERDASTILVTGLSGAGRATALNALEDCGYHRVDNLPADLIPHLILNNSTKRPLALGLGSRRSRGEYETLTKILEENHDALDMSLLFLEASPEVIARRYNETRRVHPTAKGRDIDMAVEQERKWLNALRQRADVIIDTSRLNPHELRAEIKRQFNLGDSQNLVLGIESFSYKFGTPPNADMIMDCRFLKNPHWVEELRSLTGESNIVQDFVRSDKNYTEFHKDLHHILSYTLPALQEEGRSYFNLAFGCTGGKHRSVSLAEIFARELGSEGYEVNLIHRELQNMPHPSKVRK